MEESRDAAPPTEDSDKGENFTMDSHKIKVHEALIKIKNKKQKLVTMEGKMSSDFC